MTDKNELEMNSGYRRLEDQIEWYDNRSQDAQWYYKIATFCEFSLAILIPVLAPYSVIFPSLFGVIIAVIKGLQWLNQWHQNWITYRSTCEMLKHEKYLYLEGSSCYKELTPDLSRKLLAERVEGLISTEHAKWLVSRNQSYKNSDVASDE